jgi:hypothetical protein
VHGRSLHCGEYEIDFSDKPLEPLEDCACCTADYVYSHGSCVKKPKCTATQYLDGETGECLDL